MTSTTVSRYSDKDLLEFQQLLERKLEKANKQLERTAQSLAETAESKDREGDWMDDSTSSSDIQMLEAMVHRQRKHIMDLTNALQRVKNKSYGICIITGELIDKRRLLAVPTTTKSIAAKIGSGQTPKPEKKETRTATPKKAERKILSKIVRKPVATKPTEEELEIEEEDLKDFYVEEYDDDNGVDLEEYSEEDLD